MQMPKAKNWEKVQINNNTFKIYEFEVTIKYWEPILNVAKTVSLILTMDHMTTCMWEFMLVEN